MERTASSQNRIISMRKFVSVPPARGAVLRLVTCDEQPQTLGEWTRDECTDNGARAEDIDDALSEHRDALERDARAILAWISAEGTQVSSKRLHCRLEPREQDNEQLTALGINGTERGILTQMQQHLHVNAQDTHRLNVTLIGAINTQTDLLRGLVVSLSDMLREAYADRHALHEQAGELAQALKSGPDELEPETSGEGSESEARAELMKTVNGALQSALPAIAMKVIAGGRE